jgi:NAD(P)-dependent dehydrogenase (short-subunit alcohol dehydrogenase family)
MALQDKVAIVTGAARGIGQAIALRFGQEGARVAIVDLREEEGRETVGLIEGAGGQAVFVPTDVSDRRQVQAMVDAVVKRWGTIHILVNNAGICPFEGFLEMSEGLWDQVLDVNLKGYFLCSQAVAKVMVEQKVKGRIIAVSSISSEFGGSSQAHYCASKAGINLLVKSMAISLGPHGITCNCPAPSKRTSIARPWLIKRCAPTGRRGLHWGDWVYLRTSPAPSSSSPATTQGGAQAPCWWSTVARPSTCNETSEVYSAAFLDIEEI